MRDDEHAYYSENARVYSKLAPFYDLVTAPFGRLRRRVAAFVDPGARVLDVATGTGAQAFAFAARGANVVGVDMSESMLRIARRKNRFPNVLFQQGDATELPFERESFDAASISFALHEMPPPVRERVMREMARVTKAGGSVLVIDYAQPRSALVHRIVRFYERDSYAEFVRSSISRLMEDAGIDVRRELSALRGAVRIVVGVKKRIE